MSKAIKVGIVGGAGYTGGELIRVLINHPNACVSLFIAGAMLANR
jgi:N-acetyl-gamma-glutamyl-phosphate reductase